MARNNNRLPSGGGEMGERIRNFDWSNHPLGDPDTWPEALHISLGICLSSSFPTAIYWGEDLWVLYNDAWSSIPRDRHPAALGMSARNLWTDIWDVIGPQFHEVLTTGQGTTSYDQLLPIERNGQPEETYWNYSLSPILDQNSEIVGVFNQGHEVTHKVLAERAQTEERERLRELFEQAPGAIAVLRGPEHRFEIANASYRELIDQGTNIIGRNVADVLPEVIDQGFITILDGVFTSGDPYHGKSSPINLWRDGRQEQRIIDFFYHPTRDLTGAIDGIFVEAWDVTEQHQTSENLKELNSNLEDRVKAEVAERLKAEAQLRQAQKLEAIGQLTGGIAHDFNNMLAVVLSAMNLLRRRIEPTDMNLKLVDAATDGAKRATDLTRRLLAFSRQQSLQPRQIKAGELIESMRELMGRSLGELVDLHSDTSGSQWKIYADPVQLESAVLNLALNARDAMNNEGSLTIKVQDRRLTKAEAKALDIKIGDYVAISVTDTGSGMTPDVLEKAFEPFFTTKDVGKGTGLGLSQILGFARQSNGQVDVQTEPGAGTTVTLYLPRDHSIDKTETPTASNDQIMARPGERVLIVEDDERVRASSSALLEELGYNVTIATNGYDALGLLKKGYVPDLLFTDVIMPQMKGTELANQAQGVLPDLKVLYTTGYSAELLDPALRNTAEKRLIYKPFTLEGLGEKIRDVLDQD